MDLILFGIAAAFALWAAFIVWTYFSVKRESKLVYDAALSRNEFPASEPYPPFELAYLKTSVLRVSIYRWVASLTAVIATPVVVWLLNTIWVKLYFLIGGGNEVFAEGTMVHSFYLAIGSLAGLIFVAGFFARAYHIGRKPDFDVAWEEEKAKYLSEPNPLPPATEQEAQ